jgi:hypothetical protein
VFLSCKADKAEQEKFLRMIEAKLAEQNLTKGAEKPPFITLMVLIHNIIHIVHTVG